MYRLEQLWRFTSLKMYSQQAGDLGELMVSSSLSPKVWEPERLEGLTPQKSLCVSLSEPESGGGETVSLWRLSQGNSLLIWVQPSLMFY